MKVNLTSLRCCKNLPALVAADADADAAAAAAAVESAVAPNGSSLDCLVSCKWHTWQMQFTQSRMLASVSAAK